MKQTEIVTVALSAAEALAVASVVGAAVTSQIFEEEAARILGRAATKLHRSQRLLELEPPQASTGTEFRGRGVELWDDCESGVRYGALVAAIGPLRDRADQVGDAVQTVTQSLIPLDGEAGHQALVALGALRTGERVLGDLIDFAKRRQAALSES